MKLGVLKYPTIITRKLCVNTLFTGRAIAQAVSRRLPTATARVRARVRSCGICGGQSGTGTGFLRVLRFPLLHIYHHLSSGAGTIGRHTKRTQSNPTTRN
jgi:hypothetical protein